MAFHLCRGLLLEDFLVWRESFLTRLGGEGSRTCRDADVEVGGEIAKISEMISVDIHEEHGEHGERRFRLLES